MDSMMVIFLVFYFLFIFTITAVVYILNSLALYTIAKNRGIVNPWWAWVPFLSNVLFGEITDDITRKKGIQSNYKRTFIILTSAVISSLILLVIVLIPLIISAELESEMGLGILLGVILVYFIMLAVAITFNVFYYICLYKIFMEYDKKNAVLFLVLSILFNLMFVFLFIIRNKTPEGQVFQETSNTYYN